MSRNKASTIPLQPPQAAPKLREGKLTPLFYLPATGGGQSGPGALRSKYNMMLAFVEGNAEGEAYLAALTAAYLNIQDAQAKALAVVSLPLREAAMLQERLKLPYSLLADENGATTRRMIGEDNHAALCVADRFGQIFYVHVAPTTASLPPVETAVSWLDFIQIQCPE